jgi:undecaprenyl-diphosphatase
MTLGLRRVLRPVDTLDGRVVDAVAKRRSRPLDAVFLPLSFAGALGLPWVVLASALRWRWRGGERLALPAAAATIVGGWAAGKGMKKLAFRERPCHGNGPDAVTRCPDSSSFPSDQAAAAFAGAATLAAAFPELALPLYAAAAATAFARIYVRVHHPSDVAAGALAGVAVARAAQRLAPGWPAPQAPTTSSSRPCAASSSAFRSRRPPGRAPPAFRR